MAVAGLTCDAKARWIVTTASDSSAKIFSLAKRTLAKALPSSNGNLASVLFFGDEFLYAASSKGTVTKWRVLEAPPDTIRPVIVMTQPTPNPDGSPVKFYGTEYELEGIACDDSLVREVSVNGVPVQLEELHSYDVLRLPPGMKAKNFTSKVKLDPGQTNAVEIKAVDWIGNTTSQIIPVNRVNRDQAIEVTGPPLDSEMDKAYVRVQFKNWFDIASYSVVVNLVEMVENRPAKVKRIGEIITEEVPLSVGYNQVQISVYSKSGEKIVKSFGVNRKSVAPVVQQAVTPTRGSGPQQWAVVVGVSEYANPGIPSLKYADADAQAFADFLRTPEGGGIDNDHMLVLLNKDATFAKVQNALNNFLAYAIDIDLVIIYFAGHGAPEPARPSNLYLLTYDSDPNVLRTTAFPMWQIADVLARYITAKRIVVFSDACHSGGISADYATRGMEVIKNNLINQYLTELALSKEGVVVFTASAAGEVSQEYPTLGHGVFTYYLLDGLKGAADYNNDYTITVNEVMQYVEEQVKRKTQGAQNPTRSQTQYDKNLTIATRSH